MPRRKTEPKSLEELGRKSFNECYKRFGKALRTLGNSLQDFLNGVNNFVELLKSKEKCSFFDLPSLHCTTTEDQSQLELHCYDARMRNEWDGFVVGVVKTAAKLLFDIVVTVELTEDYNNEAVLQVDSNVNHAVFKIRKSSGDLSETSLTTLQYEKRNHSTSPSDLKISVPALCSAFPFLIIFDESLQIQQLGSALTRLIGPLLSAQEKDLDKYFELLEPKVRLTFQSILGRKNGSFLLRVKSGHVDGVSRPLETDAVELRGQMVHLPESNCILFLGSPRVESIDQLKSSGLFLSDIPLHDATRGLFLVSEQAVAQDGLKKKMEQLKTELQKASIELAQEKHKTEDLLESIFPHDVAKKLIHGQTVPARFIEDVTILFSDIVGFTSICGKCAPMDVVNMLESLFTEFDRKCEQLDLNKIETIGDAYVVAGGLQNNCGTADDAVNVSIMALRMIDVTESVLSPEGLPLRMRIGLHTGSVLSGVVGAKMPRYCLFGNNVTVANKMESDSEPGKINISSTTYRLISSHQKFQFIPRPIDGCRKVSRDMWNERRYFLQWRPGHGPPADTRRTFQRWLIHS
ncbi:guanylate cyclase soluble subunit alpha-2-like isoform X2 [Oculina patagonica]